MKPLSVKRKEFSFEYNNLILIFIKLKTDKYKSKVVNF